MGKLSGILFIAVLAAGIATAWHFGFVAFEQFTYLGNMIVGWTAWTCAVAIAYAGLEKLFPNLLCPPRAEGS